MSVLTGVKYCGGCNPRYERKKFVHRLSEELGEDYQFEAAVEGKTYDVLLVIGGCTNCCAHHEKLLVRYEKLFVKSEDDFAKTLASLKGIDGLK